MKRLFTLLFIFGLAAAAVSQPLQYSRIKIMTDGHSLIDLARSGIDITEGVYRRGESLTLELSAHEIARVESLGLAYEVLIPDVSKYYVERNEGKSANVADYKGLSEWEVPENFTFGSMSGHATYDEVVEHLDHMYELFPDLITQKESIGQTIEGREIWMVKISDNPEINETEPEVLFTSLHHAREPAGLMTNLFFMYYLLENYDNDPFIQALVDQTEIYFVPVINPDGYVYNQTTNPSGGGMWRKNRRDNGQPGCMGVDLNRNYGYMWGYDDIGSSPDPCEVTYRGEAAFSEPEIAAVRDFCEAHEFVNAINYHTYSNLLLYAWGYTEEPCEDDAIFYAHSVLYTADNNYPFGAGSTTIYPTNGGSDDWMYGEQTTKNKIFGYTPELGGSSDGFWCPIDRIIPIARENMIMNVLATAFAGWYADVEFESFPLISETSGYLHYDITRLGLKEDGIFTLTLEPLSDMIISGPVTKTYEGMEILESIADSVPFNLNIGTPSGTSLKFLVTVDNGEYARTDTISRIFGEAMVLYEDDCNSMDSWVSPSWNVTTTSYVSPTGSITDSPGTNYSNNSLTGVIMTEEVDLTDAGFAMLEFNAKWEIEPGYDYVQLMISVDGATTWEPLAGNYTVTGTSNQAEGEPVYDGYQTTWVQELIDLSAYTGHSVTFRFILKSDSWLNEDGFYFDDFRVSSVEISPVGMDSQHTGNTISVGSPIPNPATTETTFSYKAVTSGCTLSIFNATGQCMSSRTLDRNAGQVTVNVGDWPAGIYYFHVEDHEGQSETGKLIVY